MGMLKPISELQKFRKSRKLNHSLADQLSVQRAVHLGNIAINARSFKCSRNSTRRVKIRQFRFCVPSSLSANSVALTTTT